MYGQQDVFRNGMPALASLAVNALLAAALLSLGMASGKERAPRAPAITVVSLAAVKGAEQGEEETATSEPAVPSERGAQPAEVPPPDSPRVDAQAVPVPQLPAHASTPAFAVAPSSLVAAPATAPRSAAQSASASAPAVTQQAAPVRRGAADGIDVRAPSGKGRSYAARVRSWLYAHKTYPRRARMRREEGVVQVRFTIDRGGVLLEGAIVRGSGNGTLDDEAMATLRRSSPFPPVPLDVAGDRIEFTVPIEFTLAA